MPLKYQVLSLVAALLLGIAGGRFLAPAQVKTVEKVVTVQEKNDNSVTHTVTTKKPDGTVTTVTEVDKHITTDTHSVDDKSTTRTYDTAKLRIAAIAATDLTRPSSLLFGGHVSYQFLGPIEIGALGLSNGTVGLSLGIRF